VLKRGSVGEPVWRLQRSLRAAGATVTLNGVYDAQTVRAVRNYRTANDLPDLQTAEAKVWHMLFRGVRA
jgi:peptidoglycan hydrolase-like protein with peptidoglycan-binding domain